MFHGLLSTLLIITTLLGPSVCCCTLKVTNPAESTKSACCGTQRDDATKHCPENSDGEKGRNCPCREHRSVEALLDDGLILKTSPSVKWIIELTNLGAVDFFQSACDISPKVGNVLRGRRAPNRTGVAVLIAHCVSRC